MGELLLWPLRFNCYFENVKEENYFVQSIKRMRKVAPPAGGAEECGDT